MSAGCPLMRFRGCLSRQRPSPEILRGLHSALAGGAAWRAASFAAKSERLDAERHERHVDLCERADLAEQILGAGLRAGDELVRRHVARPCRRVRSRVVVFVVIADAGGPMNRARAKAALSRSPRVLSLGPAGVLPTPARTTSSSEWSSSVPREQVSGASSAGESSRRSDSGARVSHRTS